MATFTGELRQGLPRVPGGGPWPAGGVAATSDPAHTGSATSATPAAPAPAPESVPEPASVVAPVTDKVAIDTAAATETALAPAFEPASTPAVAASESSASAGSARVVRQGLPRVPGGDPWPAHGVAAGAAPTNAAPISAAPASTAPAGDTSSSPVPAEEPAVATESEPASHAPVTADAAPAQTPEAETVLAAEPAPVPVAAAEVSLSETPLRRGLPRVAGGEPWPAEGFAPVAPKTATTVPASGPAADTAEPETDSTPQPADGAIPVADTSPAAGTSEKPVRTGLAASQAATPEPAVKPAEPAKPVTPATPTKAAEPVQPAEPAKAAEPTRPAESAKAATPAKPKREPVVIAGRTLATWVKWVVLGGLGAIFAAAILVLAARGVTTLPGVPEWMERYPGEYAPAVTPDPGFPWWARWSHFFNIFLMALVIRSGWQVRTQQQPPAFWTPKKGGKKISINLWLHTSLDVLWVVNGAIFVVLLFVSGHWARIVPTSFEVFPNAASAMLQYLTLDWPVEDGWVNYNALQQLMYFIIVFVAAPVAIITGLRMSEWWPEKADRLNKLYPAPLARAVHFPTMLFFVLFILVHVFLVFATGALRNLNHMFAGTDVVNWTGFWLFALAIFVTAVGWVAARPLVLAPIANLFGRVSNR